VLLVHFSFEHSVLHGWVTCKAHPAQSVKLILAMIWKIPKAIENVPFVLGISSWVLSFVLLLLV